MINEVKVSRKKPIYVIFVLIFLACIAAAIGSVFVNYCSLDGIEAGSIFDNIKFIFEIKDSETRMEALKSFFEAYKTFIIGIGLVILATLCRPGAKFSSHVSEGGIKVCFGIDIVALIIGIVGVYLTSPAKFIEPLLGSSFSSAMEAGLGATLRYAAILAPVFGIIEDILLLKQVAPTREAIEKAAEQIRQDEIRREQERNKAAQQAVIYTNPAPAQNPSQSLESKLEELLVLKEKGLLTEEEYQKKRENLIDSF